VPFAERKRYYNFTVGDVGFFVLDEVHGCRHQTVTLHS
jgi:hypothetical protein